jgi:hypothetical protein
MKAVMDFPYLRCPRHQDCGQMPCIPKHAQDDGRCESRTFLKQAGQGEVAQLGLRHPLHADRCACHDRSTARAAAVRASTAGPPSATTYQRAAALAQLRLLADISNELRRNAYDVAVRQLWQEEEVGRVTWRLAPLKKNI